MSSDDGRCLIEFSYSSRMEADQTAETLMRLARRAWSTNTRLGVTGLLRIRDRHLEQVVEGPSSIVLPLSARILSDRRHCDILIRSFSSIDVRRFRAWTVEGLSAEGMDQISVSAQHFGLRCAAPVTWPEEPAVVPLYAVSAP